MMKSNFYILPLLAFIFTLLSCSNDKLIDENKFVRIYTDLVIAHDTIPGNFALFDSVKNTILKKYKVTSEQYEYTVDYYNQDVKRWEGFFNKAAAYIDTLRSTENPSKSPKKEDINASRKIPADHQGN
jgi:hypothetical protein